MAKKIFFRKRHLYADTTKTALCHVIAVEGLNLEVYAKHLRLSELNALAEATGAELVEQISQSATATSDDWSPSRPLEVLLIQAADKAQLMLDMEDRDEELLLSVFTKPQREQFISLLIKFIDTDMPHLDLLGL